MLVVIDGVRWQDVFYGVDPALAWQQGMAVPEQLPTADANMPNLHRWLRQSGVALGPPTGIPIRASGPRFISLPGYTEIFTGRTRSTCSTNDCPQAREPTWIDELAAQPGMLPSDVAVISSWSRIGRAATEQPTQLAMSTGRDWVGRRELFDSHTQLALLLEEGRRERPAVGDDRFRSDRLTGALALAYYGLYRPRFLFVGLGEPDEYAHLSDYGGYLAALRAADRFIATLWQLLEATATTDTLVLVTTDHGRSANFRDHGSDAASGPVWLALLNARPGPWLRQRSQGWRLADIAPTMRLWFGLPLEDGPHAGCALDALVTSPDSRVTRAPVGLMQVIGAAAGTCPAALPCAGAW